MLPFSVLICVYDGDNVRAFHRALTSIFSNSLVPAEVVLVCDGSLSVDADEVILDFETRYPDVLRVVRLERNIGFAGALNHGLSAISSPITIRCDADDVNYPDRFRILIDEFIEDPEILLVGSQVREVWRSGELKVRAVPCTEVEIKKTAIRRNPFNHMSVAFKTDVVREVGGYPHLFLKEDYGLWLKLISTGKKVKNINAVLVDASFDEASISRRGGWKYVLSEWQLFKMKNQIFGVTGRSFIFFIARSFAFILPNKVRKAVYSAFLRKTSA